MWNQRFVGVLRILNFDVSRTRTAGQGLTRIAKPVLSKSIILSLEVQWMGIRIKIAVLTMHQKQPIDISKQIHHPIHLSASLHYGMQEYTTGLSHSREKYHRFLFLVFT